MIAAGAIPAADIRVGSQQALAVYAGEELVWEAVPGSTILYLTLTSNLTQSLNFTQSVADGVTVDWGDSSVAETSANTQAVLTHTYAAAGDYVVTMTPGSGVTYGLGSKTDSYDHSLLGSINGKDETTPQLTAIRIGRGCTTLNYGALGSCTSLTTIIIPDGITTVGENAFYGDTGLARIVLPDSVQAIGYAAFQSCSAMTHLDINMASSIVVTDSNSIPTFVGGCTALQDIIVSPQNLSYAAVDGILYNKAVTACLACPPGKAGNVSLPLTVQSVGRGAFYSCRNVTGHIYLGPSATLVDKYAFQGSGFATAEIGAATLERDSLPSTLTKAWIRDTVTTITAYESGSSHWGPFGGDGAGLTIYAEPQSRPSGWSQWWNTKKTAAVDTVYTTVWGRTTSPF